jgi:hypothetical protein
LDEELYFKISVSISRHRGHIKNRNFCFTTFLLDDILKSNCRLRINH